MAPVHEISDLRPRLGGSLIDPTWSPALRQAVQGQPEHSLEARRHEQFPLLFQEGASPAARRYRARGGKPANRRSPLGLSPGAPVARLCDRVAKVIRTRHYSRRTAQAYTQWIHRFQLSHSF